jgi:excisionase family DNA binding protein
MTRRSVAGEGYISTSEAARRGGYGVSHVNHLVRSGRLLGRRVGRRWFIDENALEALIANREIRSKRGRPRSGQKLIETEAGPRATALICE